MSSLIFRPIEDADSSRVAALLLSSRTSFDLDFVEMILSRRVLTDNVLVGGFDDEKLVAVYGLYAYPAVCLGVPARGVTRCFVVVASGCQNAGVGSAVLRNAVTHINRLSPDLVSGFVDRRLCEERPGRRSWSQAIDAYYAEAGFSVHRKLATLGPVFRPGRKPLPDVRPRTPESPTARLLDVETADVAGFRDLALRNCASYCLAENPADRIVEQLRTHPLDCHLFSIETSTRLVGYLSCYRYAFHKGGRAQHQVHFDGIVVDRTDLAGAVRAVIQRYEGSAFQPDIYVINNSSLLTDAFLRETGFYSGFSRLEAHLWCRTENIAMRGLVQNLNETDPFSLTVI